MLGITKCMTGLKSDIAYLHANRCSECSEGGFHIWYLKYVIICPCCGNMLRRKPKHRLGRIRVTETLNNNKHTNSTWLESKLYP